MGIFSKLAKRGHETESHPNIEAPGTVMATDKSSDADVDDGPLQGDAADVGGQAADSGGDA